jgi:hypothetical protein
MRVVPPLFAALAALALSSIACGPQGRSGNGNGVVAGTGGGAGTTGDAGVNGAAGTALVAGGSGTSGAGAAGTTAPTGAAGTTPSNPSGFDDGKLFTDAAVVAATDPTQDPSTPPDAGAPQDAGAGISGDGNVGTCHIGGMTFVLVFTQKGKDVTMVATGSNCGSASHTLQIRGGFSCDNAGTEGGVWDGKRGDGIPPLVCANGKGTLTYTRSGADSTMNWTVGDHNTKTDVTLHPMSADSSCGTFF